MVTEFLLLCLTETDRNFALFQSFNHIFVVVAFFLCVCVFVCLLRAIPMAYGGSEARGKIRAAASGLHHSHSKARSEPGL